jgi:hypothetical protein
MKGLVPLNRIPAKFDTRGAMERKQTVRTTVLLPKDLHASLKGLADRDRRSLHQEIVWVLEQFAAKRGCASQRSAAGQEQPV